MAFDWYPFYPTKFRRKTYHLCAAADGIYRRLIDEYMLTGLPLPDNDAALAGIARVACEEWEQHSAIVRAFFKSKDGQLVHKHCEQELHAQSMLAAERSKKAKEAATVRWAKEKQSQQAICREHSRSIANAMLNDATLHYTTNNTSKPSVDEASKATEKRPSELSRAELEEILTRKRTVKGAA